MEFTFKTVELDNGLRIIAEINPHARSVALSYVVLTGARDESPEQYGLSHFLEHMAFKGTARRTAEDINREFDEIGALYNAYTSEEMTAFWAAVLPEYMERALDLLSDILQPALRTEDFELEKEVIVEEIQMYRDQPTWMLFDRSIETYFAGHPLGHSILGTEESLRALSPQQMRQYHADRYRTGNILLAAAGNVDWDRLVELADRFTASWPRGRVERKMVPHRPPTVVRVLHDSRVEHAYVVAMSPAPGDRDELGEPADLLATIVGHSSGSRLYYELVEPGHADSAELERHGFLDIGVFYTFLTCSAGAAAENLARLLQVYRQVHEGGISAEEVDRAHRKVCSRIVLGSEIPSGRLSSLVHDWVYRGRYRDVDELIRDVQNIDEKALGQVLERYSLRPQVVVALGPVDEAGLRQAVEQVFGSASVTQD